MRQVRNMNIVDPLLATNNLGRSVSRANKARIRKALQRGCASLAGILEKVRPLHAWPASAAFPFVPVLLRSYPL